MKIVLILCLILLPTVASASCNCICVNNQKQMICSNSWDVPTGFCGGWCSN